MSNLCAPLSTLLRQLRLAKGIKQNELARRVGIDFRRVSAFESGRRSPSQDELERLAEELGRAAAELLLHPDGWRASSPRNRWFDGSHSFHPPRERSGEKRLSAARRLFGPWIDVWLEACPSDARDFLVLTPSQSAPEWTFQLRHLSHGAHPTRLAPLEANFRQHPVLDPETRECVGDCPVPALIGEVGEIRYLLIPQVHLRTPRAAYTLDFLGGLKLRGRSLRFFNAEVDGLGHDPRFDRERERNLAMPTVRFTPEEIGQGNFVEYFVDKTLRVFTP